jgi:hypothetical protein
MAECLAGTLPKPPERENEKGGGPENFFAGLMDGNLK